MASLYARFLSWLNWRTTVALMEIEWKERGVLNE